MSEPNTVPANETRPQRSRWLIALMSALVLAVGLEGAYMWQMHGRLEKAMAAAGPQKDDDGWTEIPRPGDQAKSQSSSAQSNSQIMTLPDPFLQPFDAQTWDPFQEMARMRAEMNQMFNQAFGRFQVSPHFGSLAAESAFSPSFDMTEEPDQYVVKIDVPGTSQHDIKVKLEGQTLTVSGMKSEQGEQTKDGKVLRRERVVGQFSRTMTLPEPVDEGAMKTTYKDGVYTITLPKLHPSSDKPSESVRMQ